MKKRILLYILGLVISACSTVNSEKDRPEVTLFSEQSGMQTTLHMIFDLNNTNKLCEKSSEIVKLQTAGKSVNPYTGFSRSGEFYVMINDSDMMEYGSYFYENIMADSIQRTVAFFSRKGSGEKAIGAVRGNIFSVDTLGNSDHIGECCYMNITTPEGEKRTLYVSRLLHKTSFWQVSLGDKIFNVDEKGTLKQAGWVDWREITTPEGKKLVILMTKGMNAKSKWAGRYNDKLYVEM